SQLTDRPFVSLTSIGRVVRLQATKMGVRTLGTSTDLLVSLCSHIDSRNVERAFLGRFATALSPLHRELPFAQAGSRTREDKLTRRVQLPCPMDLQAALPQTS